MTAVEFAYWLQGFFELSEGTTPMSAAQVDLVKKHLALVFVHDIDPKAGDAKTQEALNMVHGNASKKGPVARC